MTGTKHYAHLRYGMTDAESDGTIPLYPDPEQRMRDCGKSYKENAKSDFEREQHFKWAIKLADVFADREYPNNKMSPKKEAYRVSLIRVYQEATK